MISEKRKQRIEHKIQSMQKGLYLVLEDVHDPHNAAAILRTAEALGVEKVIYIFEHQEPYNPKKVGKLSSSTANKWVYMDIYHSTDECMNTLKQEGVTILGTVLQDDQAQVVQETPLLDEKVALVFGNERSGLTEKARKHCHKLLKFPMAGMVESFNVSVAAALFMYEIIRQREESDTKGQFHFSDEEFNDKVYELIKKQSRFPQLFADGVEGTDESIDEQDEELE